MRQYRGKWVDNWDEYKYLGTIHTDEASHEEEA